MRLLTDVENERVTLAKKALMDRFGWHEADFDSMRFTQIVEAYDKAVAQAPMYLCSRCREGVVRNVGEGWGECPVCGQDHDIACLTELKAVQ